MEVDSDFYKTLKEIRDFFDVDCDTSRWFAQAYVSWYRPGNRLVDLEGVTYLDSGRFGLFVKMLRLRNHGSWDDYALFELERYAIKLYDL